MHGFIVSSLFSLYFVRQPGRERLRDGVSSKPFLEVRRPTFWVMKSDWHNPEKALQLIMLHQEIDIDFRNIDSWPNKTKKIEDMSMGTKKTINRHQKMHSSIAFFAALFDLVDRAKMQPTQMQQTPATVEV